MDHTLITRTVTVRRVYKSGFGHGSQVLMTLTILMHWTRRFEAGWGKSVSTLGKP